MKWLTGLVVMSKKKEIFHNLFTATIIAVKGPSNVSLTMHILKFVHTSF